MKQTILAVAITIASTQAFATGIDLTNPFNHVTQPQLASEAKNRSDADKNLQSQITQHGYEINTQAKYTTSVNEDLQASKAAVSSTLNSQQSQLNAVQDAAQQANVKADSAHVRLDSVETNLGNVQTAAQIANDRASSLETHADNTESAIRETNGAVQSVNADLQNSKATVANELGKTNTAVKSFDDKVNVAINAQTNINNNQSKVNTAVQGQVVTLGEVQQAHSSQINSKTKQLANHETRITNIEDYSRDMDTRLSGRLDSQQSQITSLKRDVNKVGNIAVGALAVAGQQFSTDYQAGPQVALSGATMGGYHSVAVGFGGAVSENLFLNAAFTSAGSQTGAVVSGTYRLR